MHILIIAIPFAKGITLGQIYNIPEAGVDLLLYGDKSNIVSNYLYNQMQALPQAYNEFSERIHNVMTTSYNYVNDKLIKYGILNQLYNNGLRVIDNYYEELLTFQQLQNANLIMQRWVMAHPQIKQMYINQNLDGYSETYKNISGKITGENDYNYRLVMDGGLVPTGDGWIFKHYFEDLQIGDRELTHFEKVRIRNTWEAMDWFLSTSKFDFTLKSDIPTKMNIIE